MSAGQMSAADRTAAPVIAHRRRGALSASLILACAILVGGALRSTLAPVQEAVHADLKLDDYRMSLLQGLAASLPIAFLAVPLGRVVDRGNRVRLLFILCMISCGGTLLTAVATNFPELFLARMLATLCGFCAIPCAISAISDAAPVAWRGRALFLLTAGQYVGVAAAFAIGGVMAVAAPVAGLASWRTVHLAFGTAGLLFSLPLLFLREPTRHEVGAGVGAPLGVALGEIWTYRGVLAPLFVGQIGAVMADTAAGVWAAPILQREFGLAPDKFAGWLGGVVLLTGMGGGVLGGVLADRGQRPGAFGGVLFGAVLASGLALPGALFSIAPGLGAFAWLLGLLLLCGAVMGLVTAAAIALLVPNEIRGLCLGSFIVLGAVLGLGLAPTLVVWVGSALHATHPLGLSLALVNTVVGVISCVAFCLAAWRLRAAPEHPADVRRGPQNGVK